MHPSGGAITHMVDAADRNHVAYLRHLAMSGGGDIEEDDSYLLFAGQHGLPGMMINGVIRKSNAISPAELLARADAFYGSRARQYVVWAREHADADLIAEAGARSLPSRPPATGNESVAILKPQQPVAVPAGFTIDEVTDRRPDGDLATYLDVVANGYDLEGAARSTAESVLFSIASMQSPEMVVYLVRERASGRAVGTMASYVAEGCAGMQWAVVVPELRGLGVAPALLQQTSQRAFEQGAEFCYGMASQLGARAWKRYGWIPLTRYFRFVASAHLDRPAPSLKTARPIRRRAQ